MAGSLFVIFLFLFLGEAVARGLGVPVPGSVIGMILLTLALGLKAVRLEQVKPCADLLTKNLGLFFVPPGVGLILYFDLLRAEFLAIAGATVLSTLLVLAVTGRVAEFLERRGGAS
ncbi:MAG: CidA/LrgA family protein [Planctomycetes bacterium]|nr:CidA/LrgA family protein [Planctomycetota bacterium]